MIKRARKKSVRAFTLVELMMVIAIMAILAAATGMALAEAMQQGRVSRTQAQIARIHNLLMLRYESYRTRPLRIPPGYPGIDPTNARQVSMLKLNWLRQIMRYEMPERPNDIGVLNIATETVDPPAPDPVFPMLTMPAVSNSYRRILTQNFKNRASPPNPGPPPGLPHFFSELRNYESECLYMILATIQEGDTNGLDFLLPSEVGDTDQDGMNEVLDSWGVPIVFLRWAPAVVSPLQTQLEADPFDPMKVDAPRIHPGTGVSLRTFMLVPLVMSAGPDQRMGMWLRKFDASNVEVLHDYSLAAHNLSNIANDPYCFPSPTSTDPVEANYQFGQRYQGAQAPESADNIVNHFLSW